MTKTIIERTSVQTTLAANHETLAGGVARLICEINNSNLFKPYEPKF